VKNENVVLSLFLLFSPPPPLHVKGTLPVERVRYKRFADVGMSLNDDQPDRTQIQSTRA